MNIYVPLGLLGIIRWACWLFRRAPAAMYRPFRSDFSAPMSVVTPVYKEDPEIFEIAVRSWLDAGVEEVICVIDVTDHACKAVAQRLAASRPVKIVMTSVPGKRDALRKGWEEATTELVALVDSDTIWAPDVARKVCEPFANPRIGGVGTRQNVYQPTSVWQKLNDAYLDYRYFDENAAQTVMGKAVSCLSGRTAVYRRQLLLELSEEFMGETFLGVHCNSGDDKRLTTLLLERGHLTYMQQDARVWSTFPAGARAFFKQRMRWSRNTWRSDLRALSRLWPFRFYPFLALTMLDKAVSSFTILVAPIVLVSAFMRSRWDLVILLPVWWLVSRSLKMLPHLRRRPKHVTLIPMLIAVSFVLALLKVGALMTIRRQRWLTRPVAVVHGELVRTEAMA